MSSPLTTDLKSAVAIIMAALLVACIPVWVFMFPAIMIPDQLVTFATLALQFLFGIAGTELAIRSYRASRIDE